MSNKGFIARLGEEYCNQRLVGALFLRGDEVHEFSYVNENTVITNKYTGTPESTDVEATTVPASEFTGWKSLSWPTLGYRQAADGQVLALIGRKASVQRGLNRGQLTAQPHPITYATELEFGLDYSYFLSGNALVLMTMKPKFTSFSEGLSRIMAGSMPAFAVSADFAVAPNDDVDFLEVLFRGRRIGTISDTGKVSITADGILPSWNHATRN